jgi:hypothetical protein
MPTVEDVDDALQQRGPECGSSPRAEDDLRAFLAQHDVGAIIDGSRRPGG